MCAPFLERNLGLRMAHPPLLSANVYSSPPCPPQKSRWCCFSLACTASSDIRSHSLPVCVSTGGDYIALGIIQSLNHSITQSLNQITDYLDVIKDPIDLTMIEKRLNQPNTYYKTKVSDNLNLSRPHWSACCRHSHLSTVAVYLLCVLCRAMRPACRIFSVQTSNGWSTIAGPSIALIR
jgi:hypothetical protein